MIESTKPKYLSMSANCIFRLLNLIFQLQKYSHCECANFGRFEMKKKTSETRPCDNKFSKCQPYGASNWDYLWDHIKVLQIH
jgi:hypothetical protein